MTADYRLQTQEEVKDCYKIAKQILNNQCQRCMLRAHTSSLRGRVTNKRTYTQYQGCFDSKKYQDGFIRYILLLHAQVCQVTYRSTKYCSCYSIDLRSGPTLFKQTINFNPLISSRKCYVLAANLFCSPFYSQRLNFVVITFFFFLFFMPHVRSPDTSKRNQIFVKKHKI